MWKKVCTVLMVGGFVLLCMHMNGLLIKTNRQQVPPITKPEPVSEDTLSKDAVMEMEHAHRLHHLRQVCSDPGIYDREENKTRLLNSLLYSKEYNFAFCKVAKAGGTFWVQLFAILSKGAQSAMSIFSKARMGVHLQYSSEFRNSIDLRNDTARPRTVVVSRDPYSRLFSAYIDKIYLPIMWPLAVKIESSESHNHAQALGCGNNATFSGFLSRVVIQDSETDSFNVHWIPITKLCQPCDLDIYIVVKQESFTADVEFAMKQLKIRKDELESINAGMKSRRAESTIPGIVKTVLGRTKTGKASKCLSATDIAKRLWTSFQIQGFIHDKFTFPLKKFESSEKARNITYLSDAIVAAIKRRPLTSEERTIQRRRYLVKAYQSVPTHIIDRLQNIYRPDFRLFGYSFLPPTQL